MATFLINNAQQIIFTTAQSFKSRSSKSNHQKLKTLPSQNSTWKLPQMAKSLLKVNCKGHKSLGSQLSILGSWFNFTNSNFPTFRASGGLSDYLQSPPQFRHEEGRGKFNFHVLFMNTARDGLDTFPFNSTIFSLPCLNIFISHSI